jgi:peptidyl-prolyl cis-trans isomerase C
MNATFLKTLCKEPLLHFLLIGAALFGLQALLQPRQLEAPSARRIVISQGDIERLRLIWQMQWQRPPTAEEWQGLLEAHIREEVLYRQALALGLDRDDTIVRRRLAQKFEFLAQDLAASHPPTDAELASFFEQHRERYRLATRLSFSHVYFNPDRRGPAVERDTQDALTRLRAEAAHGAAELGDPFLLDYELRQKTTDEVEQMFGRAFAEAVVNVAPDTWQGPIASGYGWHLVKVDERTAARLPELAEVKDQVQRDWADVQRRMANEEVFARLRARYEVVIQEPATTPPEVAKAAATPKAAP